MSPVETMSFDPEKHFDAIVRWNDEQKLSLPLLRRLPKVGLVAPPDNPCAAGFLMQTDCSEAWITELIADPYAQPLDRGRALVAVVLGLLTIARQMGYESLRITTHWRGVFALAKRLGGEVNPNLVVISSDSWVTE